MSEAIPVGWQRRSLSSLGEYENGFAFNELHWSEHGLPIVRIAQITGTQGIVDRYPGRLPETFRIDSGDLIFSWSGTLAVVRWAGGPAWLNQHLFKVVPAPSIDRSLLFHVLQASVAEMNKRTHGSTMKHIKRGELREFFVSIPVAVDEQRKLASVLDTLDAASDETEVIIAKLKAVKQGLLHDLLTRGIDANGELRPPQCEAPQLYTQSPLGWIPKEWGIATLEAVSATVTSGSRDWARFYADSGALFVRIGNLTREHINFRFDSTIYVRPPRNADGQRTRLEPGDILISITADLGIVGVVPDGMGEAYINQHIALVRPSHGVVNPRFVGHYLASPAAQTYISKLNDAGAKAGLNLPTVRGLLTARPARTEQDLIAERLDEIDHRIQNAATESAKLRELKAGLMDDLLTGRVRVTPLLAEVEREKECA
jgi:type I restriction enzyme S subunit